MKHEWLTSKDPISWLNNAACGLMSPPLNFQTIAGDGEPSGWHCRIMLLPRMASVFNRGYLLKLGANEIDLSSIKVDSRPRLLEMTQPNMELSVVLISDIVSNAFEMFPSENWKRGSGLAASQVVSGSAFRNHFIST